MTIVVGPLDPAAFARAVEALRQLAAALGDALRQLAKAIPAPDNSRKILAHQQVWPAPLRLQSRVFDARSAILARRRKSCR